MSRTVPLRTIDVTAGIYELRALALGARALLETMENADGVDEVVSARSVLWTLSEQAQTLAEKVSEVQS